MRKLAPTSWIAIACVALIQTAALLWIVYGRVSLLRDGREIVSEVVPVDPRDLFRGDYVIFGYPFSGTGDLDVPAGIKQGDAVYVTLRPTGPDAWQIASVEAQMPASTAPENVVMKGIVSNLWTAAPGASAKARVRYGIESYFVPEGTGRELEELVRDKKIAAVIAVGKNGDAAIKALMIDGRRVVEEPLL